MTVPYRHKEAFCLMWYACPCGHRERIWNSRDGVTPFGGIRCPSCNSTTTTPSSMPGVPAYAPGMSHVDWQLDLHAPDHKLAPGQRFWRDGTIDEAIEALERRFVTFEARGHPVPQNIRDSMLSEARAGTGGDFPPGWPRLDRNSDKLEIPALVNR